MNYWIISDTHFGHDKVIEYCGRPKDFESKILLNLRNTIKKDDVVIHLGDFCWGDHTLWHEDFKNHVKCKRWLIRGNHDKKSYSWFHNNGWDFMAENITLYIYGKQITFSHKPLEDNGYDLNIHGHFHNSDHRRHESDLLSIKNGKQKLVMMEHNYMPINLKKLI
ncbi:hypothetical protein KAR91_49430 [Candidatus Pacearchaeota archaeon]|nr:hypothetical protein [Candidatus Pacearchaeota archaeon]